MPHTSEYRPLKKGVSFRISTVISTGERQDCARQLYVQDYFGMMCSSLAGEPVSCCSFIFIVDTFGIKLFTCS